MADAKITALTENTTPLVTDLLAMVDDPGGSPLTQKIQFLNALFTIADVKIYSLTRDQTAANATVQYTSVGFLPRNIIFIALIDQSVEVSIGFSNLTTNYAISSYGNNKFTNWSTSCIGIDTGLGAGQTATVSAFGSDGFSLDWVKNGLPGAGTITVYAFILR